MATLVERLRASWGCVRPEPVRVRCWLASEVAWDAYDGLSLEGPLQCLALERVLDCPRDEIRWPAAGVWLPTPLATTELAGEGVALCSWAIPSPLATESLRKLSKRARADVLPLDKVLTSGGAYKSLHLPVPTLATPFVDFCAVADRARLAELLRGTWHLGRRASGGLGAVLGVELLPEPEGRALLWRGRPQRELPVADEHEAAVLYDCSHHEVRHAAVRAPRWHRAHKTLAAVPCGEWWA